MAIFLFHTGIDRKSFPSKLIDPESGVNRPAIVFKRVVLPERVLPKIVYILPGSKWSETLFK
jgi:hypothetical protein